MSDIDQRQEQHQRHMRELTMIRDIARTHEQKPLVASWAFFVCGAVVIAATLLHYSSREMLGVQQALLRIWAPALVVVAAGAAAAWYSCMRRQSSSGLWKRSVQLLLGFCGLTVVLVVLVVTLLAEDALTPGVLLLLLSLPLLLYAEASFLWLFAEVAVALGGAAVVLNIDLDSAFGYLMVGLLFAVLLLASGVHQMLLERLHRE